jgi:hypothetical protein
MSRFTMKFRWQESTQELTWEDGTLSSPDDHLVDYVQICAEAAEGRLVGLIPTGPFTSKDHLKDALSTLCLLQEIIPPGDWIDVTGEVPEPPELPEGAIP